ncbi:MAG TPA: hypothetical protein PKH77_21185 [Anaerolineae bacterium]|nr:hypothetical protein [Anaerolineae bacterium]
MKFIQILAETGKCYYEEVAKLILMGTVSLLCCLLILPGPFAFGGLWAVGQRTVRGVGIKWEHYWQGVKEYGWRNFILTVVLLLGYIIGFTNLWFYNTPTISPFPAEVAVWVTPIWIVLLVVWTGVSFYANALLVELTEPKLWLALRGGLFLTLLNPLSTFLFIVLSLILLALCIFLPFLIILTPGLLLILRLTAVRTLVQAAITKQETQTDKAKNTEDI